MVQEVGQAIALYSKGHDFFWRACFAGLAPSLKPGMGEWVGLAY